MVHFASIFQKAQRRRGTEAEEVRVGKDYLYDRSTAEIMHYENDPRQQYESGEGASALENGNQAIQRKAAIT